MAPTSGNLIGAPAESRQGGCHLRKNEVSGGANMNSLMRNLWRRDEGQDIAEYAVMLAVILVLVVGTIRLVGSHANNVFSSAASVIQ
jgi:Flp pilus assembly pilin Flp